jgi:hypothetical protein
MGINFGEDKDGNFTLLKDCAVKYTAMFLANWAVKEVFGFRYNVYGNFWKQVYRGSYAMYNRNFDHLNYHEMRELIKSIATGSKYTA